MVCLERLSAILYCHVSLFSMSILRTIAARVRSQGVSTVRAEMNTLFTFVTRNVNGFA